MRALKFTLTVVIAILLCGSGLAATNEWLGAVSTALGNDNNWSEAGGFAVGDDLFYKNPTGKFMCDAGDYRKKVQSITFTHGGWRVYSSGTATFQFGSAYSGPGITSSGDGTNWIDRIEIDRALPVIVNEGNTLIIGRAKDGSTRLTKTGAGTLVFTNSLDGAHNVYEGTLLINGPTGLGGYNSVMVVSNNATIGGNGQATAGNSGRIDVYTNCTFAPGPDGANGAVTGTFSLDNTHSSRTYQLVLKSGSTCAIDLRPDGSNDAVVLNADSNNTCETLFVIDSGVTLALAGEASIGESYTIATLTGRAELLAGAEFDAVTLNDVPLVEGDDYDITYTTKARGDTHTGSIVVTMYITGGGPTGTLIMVK